MESLLRLREPAAWVLLVAVAVRLLLSLAVVVSVGFGISTPQQAASVARLAEGVVVGSAFVRLIEQSADEKQLESFAHQLRQGMDT